MPETSADVEFREVGKSFGSAVALYPSDLQILRGEFLALLGPSGCGKTTTLRIVAGFEQPTCGRVFIRGQDVTAVPPHKRDFSMVFQSYALFPHLTVAENVAFGLRMRRISAGERGKRVADALAMVKLSGFESRFPRQLSGGQQQRVAVARAIVLRPTVLLLDEPLGALDKALRDEMQIELRQLQQSLGITTVFVTHDQEEALTMADRIAVMNHGRMVQVGPPQEVYERPRTPFVAGFLGASNLLPATVVAVRGTEVDIDVLGTRVRLNRTDLRVGSTITVSIRPERISLHPPTAANAYTVTSAVYRGANRQLTLTGQGQTLTALVPNRGEARFAPGEHVDWSAPAEAVVVLEGDAG